MPFLEGYIAGLALIILIGPVLFVLIKASLEHGKRAGILVALGIFVSDIIAVLLCSFGAAPFLQDPSNQSWLALGGGLLLAALGMSYIIRPNISRQQSKELGTGKLLSFFIKGFAVNFINPFVFMVWIGIITAAMNRHGFDFDLALFLSGTLLAILTLDTTKVFLAQYLNAYLKDKTFRIIVRISGVLLLGFGLRLVIYGM